MDKPETEPDPVWVFVVLTQLEANYPGWGFRFDAEEQQRAAVTGRGDVWTATHTASGDRMLYPTLNHLLLFLPKAAERYAQFEQATGDGTGH